MIKELMHDPIFLAGKSDVATKEDLQVAQDLLDTLMAHRERCVGMAANMIGVRKRTVSRGIDHQPGNTVITALFVIFLIIKIFHASVFVAVGVKTRRSVN